MHERKRVPLHFLIRASGDSYIPCGMWYVAPKGRHSSNTTRWSSISLRPPYPIPSVVLYGERYRLQFNPKSLDIRAYASDTFDD